MRFDESEVSRLGGVTGTEESSSPGDGARSIRGSAERDSRQAPWLELNVGGGDGKPASYSGVNGASRLLFSYTVVEGHEDTNGISINANELTHNGATIVDAADSTKNAVLTHGVEPADPDHKVDGVRPVFRAQPSSQRTRGMSAAPVESVSEPPPDPQPDPPVALAPRSAVPVEPETPPARPDVLAAAEVLVTPPGTLFRVGGGSYTVPISITGVSQLSTISLTLSFDPNVLRVRTVQEGSFMRQGGAQVTFQQRVDTAAGRVDMTVVRMSDPTGAAGAGLLATALWDSTIQLGEQFFNEIIRHPHPRARPS